LAAVAVVWSLLAQHDLDRAADHMALLDPDLSDRLLAEAGDASVFLQATPRGGAPINGDLRKYRLATMPYMLIYAIKARRLSVYRFVHIRSDWASLA
jgi:plasmid stabilization system protein ParE